MLGNVKAFSGFSVDDIEKVKSFYSGTLGLTVKDNPMGLLELHFKEGNAMMVYPKPDHIPATFTVLNFIVHDIEQTVNDLIETGITFEQYEGEIKTDEKGICRSGSGPTIAWFKDPAGNILSLIEGE